nr:hypothetical protein Itr_chr08CG16200 [Ipomoea trifida]
MIRVVCGTHHDGNSRLSFAVVSYEGLKSGGVRLPDFLNSFSDGFDLLSRIGNPGIVSRRFQVSEQPFVFVLLLLRLHHHVPDLGNNVLQDIVVI